MLLEALALLHALRLWGPQLEGHGIRCHVNNSILAAAYHGALVVMSLRKPSSAPSSACFSAITGPWSLSGWPPPRTASLAPSPAVPRSTFPVKWTTTPFVDSIP